MKHVEMKVYALVFVVVLSLMTIGAVWAAERQFREPTIEERPVVERRLVCPDGFELYELNKKYVGSGLTTLSYETNNAAIVWRDTESPQTGAWQQGALPNPKEHVCVTKEEAKKHEKHADPPSEQ